MPRKHGEPSHDAICLALLRVSASDKIRAANKAAWRGDACATGLTSEETDALRRRNIGPDTWEYVQRRGWVQLAATDGYELTDAGRAEIERMKGGAS